MPPDAGSGCNRCIADDDRIRVKRVRISSFSQGMQVCSRIHYIRIQTVYGSPSSK